VVRLGPRRRRPWWHFLTASDQLAREFRRSVGTTVADVMTHPVITASPSLPLASAALLFDTPSIRLVPVVGGGRLVGTVSRHDLLRGLVSDPPEQVWQSDTDLVTRMQAWMAEEHGWVPIPPRRHCLRRALDPLGSRGHGSAEGGARDDGARDPGMPGTPDPGLVTTE